MHWRWGLTEVRFNMHATPPWHVKLLYIHRETEWHPIVPTRQLYRVQLRFARTTAQVAWALSAIGTPWLYEPASSLHNSTTAAQRWKGKSPSCKNMPRLQNLYNGFLNLRWAGTKVRFVELSRAQYGTQCIPNTIIVHLMIHNVVSNSLLFIKDHI